eukprot:gene8676-9613_t
MGKAALLGKRTGSSIPQMTGGGALVAELWSSGWQCRLLNPGGAECPQGLKCCSISQHHYKKYCHNLQALKRSGNGCDRGEMACERECLDMNTSGDSVDLCLTSSFDENTSKEVVSDIVKEIEDPCDTTNIHSKYAEHLHRTECCSTEAMLSRDCYTEINSSGNLPAHSSYLLRDNEQTETTGKESDTMKHTLCSEVIVNGEKKLCQIGIGSYFGLKNPIDSKLKQGNNVEVDFSSEEKQNTFANQASSSKEQRRQCPFYKKIPGTAITVDAFSYGVIPGCKHYFLSHFHYDHYGGLKKSFTNNIYCSKITADLVKLQIKVDSKYINSLPMNEEVIIDNVKVMLLEANHCPGSVMFLFKLKNGKILLHTGDFRASKEMINDKALQRVDIDTIYLDTTYLNPSYNFPTQQETVDFAVRTSLKAVHAEPRTLIVCGTYSVGKERVFVAIANALNCKISAKADKKRILNCLSWKDLDHRLTSDWHTAQVHVLPMNSINADSLQKHLDMHKQFKKIVAFKPTGWTFSKGISDVKKIKPKTTYCISIYGIPYSEHSSFSELELFVKHFKPKKIIPTVNVGSVMKRNQMQRILNEWSNYKQ